MQGELFDGAAPVEQLHWGGGTPTFISHEQMRELMAVTGQHFNLLDDDSGEYSIEIDPREADAETVGLLREIGFNRMSLGVQDFDDRVQKAVNRIQSEAETLAVLNAARAEGFRSISIDLIYGLPFQSVESFAAHAGPDHRAAAPTACRCSTTRTCRSCSSRSGGSSDGAAATRGEAGHSADDQRQADRGGLCLHRHGSLRPAGRRTGGGPARRHPVPQFPGLLDPCRLRSVGLGVTSIGKVGPTYSQNVKTLDDYYARIDAGQLPVFRGIELTRDDQLRRDVITRLICNFELRFADIEQRWGLDFSDYFDAELKALETMQADGLLTLDGDRIEVLPRGRLLIRNICMVFDAYLSPDRQRTSFSRVI